MAGYGLERRKSGSTQLFAFSIIIAQKSAAQKIDIDSRTKFGYNNFCCKTLYCGHGGIGRRVRLRGVWETV